jgi:hypothetical protein
VTNPQPAQVWMAMETYRRVVVVLSGRVRYESRGRYGLCKVKTFARWVRSAAASVIERAS